MWLTLPQKINFKVRIFGIYLPLLCKVKYNSQMQGNITQPSIPK